ncbi:MAG: hypothetical protein WC558_13620 [Patulibacter sp.]
MSNHYTVIRDAIVAKQQIHATYQGLRREMCPHAIGTKGGSPQALFVQFAGESSSGLPAEGAWRCLKVSELSDVEARDGEWHTLANHSQRSTCIDVIDTEVAH